MKRAFDLTFALVGLILLAVPMGLVALAITLQDGGPVFFRQERIGQGGRLFRIWKFRTMVVDAPKLGASITIGADHRITGIGAFLRRFKLDEFPQLLNVVRGEMGFVGPRPEVPRYVALYSEAQQEVLRLMPGITDWASIKYRNESDLLAAAEDPEALYIGTIMADKIRLNLAYACQANLLQDFKVILKTVLKISV